MRYVLWASAAVAAAAGSCSTDEDCNLNGICNSKTLKCDCVPEWTGDRCGALNMLPARPRPMSGFDEVGNSSWGGTIMADPKDSTRFHMIASRIAGHCGARAQNHIRLT
jgi:hypothetical protein